MSSAKMLIDPQVEERVNQLLSQMTLEEKLGQMNQYFPAGGLDEELLRSGKVGSVISAAGILTGQEHVKAPQAEVNNHIQSLALESRLKIPVLFGRDIVHGYRTVFPIPLAQAATWNTALVEQAAAVAADEATADGIHWTFGPMLDIARDARWGRIAEGNGEDPYLSSRIAEALVRGFQGDDIASPDRLIACAKHYAGYGAAEGGRDYEGAEISEASMRDVYLKPFKAAVDAGVGTVMSGFLDVNGTPVTANKHILNDILRDEWGFEGFVISDWGSIGELISHGYAENEAEAGVLALQAGTDMDMAVSVFINTLGKSLEQGKVTLDQIDTAVRRILRLKFRSGLFENPLTDVERSRREKPSAVSRIVARKMARESMVLLKNEHAILPLDGRFQRVLVAGPFIHAQEELFGCWSPDGDKADVTPLDKALRQAAPQGMQLWFTHYVDEALAYAHEADAVLLLLGEHPRRTGENNNVADISLPPGQAEFVDAITALGKPTAMVVFAGRPLALGRQAAQVDALLYAWHPGVEGGEALAELLFGIEAPTGRLPVTMPRVSGQVPIYYNHKRSGRPLEADGQFKTRYQDTQTTPLYPFGYGLGYTSFAYDNLQLSNEKMHGSITISAQVSNTGSRAGVETVQLYIRDVAAKPTRPVRELKGYQQISLQPGETHTVQFTLTEADLAYTQASGVYAAEPGVFHVWIAPNSADGLFGRFRL